MSVRGNRLLVADDRVESLRESIGDSGSARQRTPSTLRFLLEEELWRDREVKRLGGKRVRFESFREFLETPVLEGLGYSIEEVKAAVAHDPEVTKLLALVWDGSPLPKHGGKREKGKQGTNGTLIRGQTREYRLRRIQRDRPDIYAKLIAGEFKSVNAAWKECGFNKPPPPIDDLRRDWARADLGDRVLFTAERRDEIEDLLEAIREIESGSDVGIEEDQGAPPRRSSPRPGGRNRNQHGQGRAHH